MMTDRDTDRVELVHRVTYPTASFSLLRSQIAWIAAKASALGLSKSEYMRRLVAKAQAEDEVAA